MFSLLYLAFYAVWLGLILTFIKCKSRKPALYLSRTLAHAGKSSRHPKNQRKPQWVRQELLRLAALSRGSRHSVAHLFNRLYEERYGETVSVSFTCDFLKHHAMQVLRLRRELASKSPRLVPVCHTWAMDLTFYTDDNKQTHANLGILDHGSRALLCLRTLTQRNAWTFLGLLCLTIGRYGKPRKLRADNEAVFHSWVFRTFLALTGIQKQTTNVHSPWQNGRMECLFGSLKPILYQLHISGKTQLQAVLNEFRLFYNHARPHMNLNYQTPAQVWQQQASLYTRRKRPSKNTPKSKPIVIQAFNGHLTGVYEPPD